MDAIEKMGVIDRFGWPVPFSLEFFTANVLKQSGGELMVINHAVIYAFIPKKRLSTPHAFVNKKVKMQTENQLFNIAIVMFSPADRGYVPTGEIIKVHARLITKFNGRKIKWQ